MMLIFEDFTVFVIRRNCKGDFFTYLTLKSFKNSTNDFNVYQIAFIHTRFMYKLLFTYLYMKPIIFSFANSSSLAGIPLARTLVAYQMLTSCPLKTGKL